MSKWKNFIFLSVMVLFLIIAGGLALRGPIMKYFIQLNVSASQKSTTSSKDIKVNQKKTATFDYAAVQSVSFEDILKSQMNRQNYPVIGDISIPELQINLPIFKGVDPNALMAGAGTLKENQVMGQGNYTLASHHIFDSFGYSGANLLFSPLMRAQKGQSVYITDLDKVYHYVIHDIQTVPETKGDVILDEPGKKEITLVTCYDAQAQYRLVVKAQLKDVQGYDEKSAELFSQEYRQNLW